MKKYILYLIPALVVGCNNHQKTGKKISFPNESRSTNGIKKDPIAINDTAKFLIPGLEDDSLEFSKSDLQKVLKYHPELSPNEISQRPDETYASRNCNNDTNGDQMWLFFGSEQGRDLYYELYAYFLSRKNQNAELIKQRDTLIKLFRDINKIMMYVNDGGTYYGHQYKRILGYAEYALYVSKNNNYFVKNYSISKQKAIYIQSLKQFINDELANNYNYLKTERIKVKSTLSKTVTEIDGLITNYFYLQSAMEFQYSNY